MEIIERVAQEVPQSYIPIFIEMVDLDTMEQIVEYRSKQTKENQRRVDLLMALIRLEGINQQVNAMDSYPEAENLLKKISKSA